MSSLINLSGSFIPSHNKKNVIFVDWYGVLSTDVFWQSIISKENHPLHSNVKLTLSRLFRKSNSQLVRNWMLGRISNKEIILKIGLTSHTGFSLYFWEKQLLRDCLNMKLNYELTTFLKHLSAEFNIVIATDNMSCVADAIKLREDLDFIEDVICSADVGCLKSENPHEFFVEWANKREINISNCLFIDDRLENCKAFESIGGKSILFQGNSSVLCQLKNFSSTDSNSLSLTNNNPSNTYSNWEI